MLLFRCATGEAWPSIMLSCEAGRKCDPSAVGRNQTSQSEFGGAPVKTCGSSFTYAYFVSFIFFCSFLMLNLFVAVIMDNFDYLTRDSSILGAHHLDEFIRIWAEYDPSATGRIHYSEMYDMLKNMDPPLGFGSKCPDRLAYKKLIRMNMPLDQEGKVNFTTTLFALIRENLSIKMRSAEEMDQADVELRETILKVWPFTAKEKIELLVPTTREIGKGKLTVGKIYGGLLILENWKQSKFGNVPMQKMGISEMIGRTTGIGGGGTDSMSDHESHWRSQSPGQYGWTPSPRRRPGMTGGDEFVLGDAMAGTVDFVRHEIGRFGRAQTPVGRYRDMDAPETDKIRKIYAEAPILDDYMLSSPRRQYLRDYDPKAWTEEDYNYNLRGNQSSNILERPSRTPSPLSHRRQRLSSSHHPGGQWSSLPPLQAQQSASLRRSGGRRLPATPNKPSTLNIDSLANAVDGGKNLEENGMPINFPKLEPSPTRTVVAASAASRKGARLPEVMEQRRTLPPRQTVGRWSRSLDDPVTFEEAVIAGRGTRQLPAVGPQQLLQSGRGRGAVAFVRRELPRPGTSIGFVANANQAMNGHHQHHLHTHPYSESEDDEDWC